MARQTYNPAPIREIRERRGLSQEAVTRRLRRPQSWLSVRETGKVPFDLLELVDLAPVLGTTPRRLAAAAYEPAGKGGR